MTKENQDTASPSTIGFGTRHLTENNSVPIGKTLSNRPTQVKTVSQMPFRENAAWMNGGVAVSVATSSPNQYTTTPDAAAGGDAAFPMVYSPDTPPLADVGAGRNAPMPTSGMDGRFAFPMMPSPAAGTATTVTGNRSRASSVEALPPRSRTPSATTPTRRTYSPAGGRGGQHRRVGSEASGLVGPRVSPSGANYFDLAVLGLEQLAAPSPTEIPSAAGTGRRSVVGSGFGGSAGKEGGKGNKAKHKKGSSLESFSKVFGSLAGSHSRKKSGDGSMATPPAAPTSSTTAGSPGASDRFFPRTNTEGSAADWPSNLSPAPNLRDSEFGEAGVPTTRLALTAPRQKQTKRGHARSKSEMSVLLPTQYPTVDQVVVGVYAGSLGKCDTDNNDPAQQEGFDFNEIWQDDLSTNPTTGTMGASHQNVALHPLKGPGKNCAGRGCDDSDQAPSIKQNGDGNLHNIFTTSSSKKKKSHKHKRVSSMPAVTTLSLGLSPGGGNISPKSPKSPKSPNGVDGKSPRTPSRILLKMNSKNHLLKEKIFASKKLLVPQFDGKGGSDVKKSESTDSLELIAGAVAGNRSRTASGASGEGVTTDETSTTGGPSTMTEPIHDQPKEIVLRSCELEPSLHQVELPSCNDVLLYARVTALADSYRIVDQNFSFATLVGLSRMSLQGFASGSLPPPPSTSGALVEAHRPIAIALLDCDDDLVLQRFFRFGEGEEHNSTEVAIYSSERHRQFVVCYRGTTEQQKKPVSTKHAKQKEEGGGASILHADHKVPVNAAIKAAYFAGDMENIIFDTLNQLSSEYPFFDVVATGHSFGATLATLGALRYASLFPMMRVSAVVFGCPRIGGTEFRTFANSLPNLKIMRLEQGEDPWVSMPEGQKWTHAGHSIVMSAATYNSSSPSPPPPPHASGSFSASERNNDAPGKIDSVTAASPNKARRESAAVAYRFDKRRPTVHSVTVQDLLFGTKHGVSRAKRGDHEIVAYVHAVEKFTHLGLPWVSSYVGEDGTGVSGSGQENRFVV